MVKTFITLRHMSDKKFGVEFSHEKVSSGLGFGFVNLSLSRSLATHMARKVMEVKIKEFNRQIE